LVLGLVFGVVLPFVVVELVRFRLLGAEPKLQPLLPLAIGVTLYALCHLTHANPYLAAFSAGAVLTARSLEAKEAFEPLGEALAELATFAALLVFGALLIASVVYGLLVLQAGIPQGDEAFTLIAVCIAFSIVAHSSTDVPIARLFKVADIAGIPGDESAPVSAGEAR
jgi:NhaP-type Na+/H+ or K+/H+ antiporter